jgi:hypothetical protein
MEEIKVNDYVRTNRGVIYQYTEDEKNDIMLQDFRLCNDGKILEHSPDIIDLVHEGDYVNENKVINMNGTLYVNGYFKEPLEDIKIKSIITKEQIESIKYEV